MTETVEIEIYAGEIAHDHGLPVYAQPGDAGMDIRANVRTVVYPGETRLIPTGLYVAIPEGFELQIRPRSGMSLKTALRIANAPGTIDSAYRGEIQIIMENTSPDIETILAKGERVAQIVAQRVPSIRWLPVLSREELGTTARGAGGFGSTGQQELNFQG